MTLDLIYPEYLQKLFTNREKELKLLNFIRDELKEGRQTRLAFFGLRRIGKSLILKEFLKNNLNDKKINVVYLNYEEFTSNPEDFSFNYIARICFWLFGKDNLEEFLIPEKLLIKVPEKIREDVAYLISELQKEKINRTNLLNFIFSFPFLISKKLNIKIILLIDEFQKIMGLKRFKDCENILDLFRAKIEAKNINYVIAGSAISVMHNLVAESGSPLFGQFKEEPIEYFDKISARKLVSKIMKDVGLEVKDFIYNLVEGHPFYLSSIVLRVKMLNKILNLKINKELIKRAFIVEVLSKSGDINKHCEYVYDTSLERARFSQTLKSILKILTKEELNQSQLARKLKITQGAVRTYLNALIEVDLIEEKNGKYFFKDKVLRYWLSYRELGVEIGEFPKEAILSRLIKQLEEKYLRASTELGKTKEYEYKVKLEKKFDLKLENYFKKNIELDLVGKKKNLWYIFEIKHRNKEASYKDIKKFLEKVKKSEFKKTKLFFISKSGFTKEAEKLMNKNKIEVLIE